MSSEDEQIQQRRANLAKLRELGVNAYPHRFDRTATITELVRAHGEKDRPRARSHPHRHDDERPHSRHSQFRQGEFPGALRRPVAHPGVHQEGLAVGARLRGVPAARFRRRDRRRRASVPHAHQRADDLGVANRVSGEVPSAAAGEMAWPDRHRNPLSPALPRSHRQSRGARGVSGAQQGARGAAGVSRQPRVPRSRDADDAADCRRRDGAAVPHASQRARCRSVSADCARAVSEAARRGRPRARLRDQRGISATRAFRRGTIPSSRCSSSIRPTATTRT